MSVIEVRGYSSMNGAIMEIIARHPSLLSNGIDLEILAQIEKFISYESSQRHGGDPASRISRHDVAKSL